MPEAKKVKLDNWGKRLSAVLKEKTISFRRAAILAKVAPSVIDSWSGGASPTDIQAVKRLCDALDISFTWLLTGTYDKGIHNPCLTELFEELPYFDGLARIRIDRLILKADKDPHDKR